MMRPSDALKIEGTDDYLILCYGVFDFNGLDLAYKELSSTREGQEVFKFWDEGWSNGIVLLEIRIKSEDGIVPAIHSASNAMLEIPACRASLCMFEGVFPEFGCVFESNLSDYIYSFSFLKNDIVVALNEGVIASSAWKSLIALAKEKLNA